MLLARFTLGELRPYQVEAVEAIDREWETKKSTLLVLATGCHRAGTHVLMYDGSTRAVEDVCIGDRLMGPDSTPRTVQRLVRGSGDMVEVRPTKGDPWVVNMDHVLSFEVTGDRGDGSIVDMSCREWFLSTKTTRHTHKLFRSGVTFPPIIDPTIDPYVFGVILGDGALTGRSLSICKPDPEIWPPIHAEAARFGLFLRSVVAEDRPKTMSITGGNLGGKANPLVAELRKMGVMPIASEHRFIPDCYKLGSETVRLSTLAGLMDTDGCVASGGYDYVSKSSRLSNDVAFIARSLGLAAYVRECRKGCQTGAVGTYYRVTISGDCTGIPVLIPRKAAPDRKQKKNVLRTGCTLVQTNTVESYFGFQLDGDHRYLLADFTVTHNCGKTRVASEVVKRRLPYGKVLWLAHREELVAQARDALAAAMPEARIGIEKAQRYARLNGFDALSDDIVVASIQTLHERRRQRFDPLLFRTVVADESHHSTASSWRSAIDHFKHAKVLGLTATPDRSDKVGLHNVFESVAHEYDMHTAIGDGYLVPLIAQAIEVEGLDLSSVKTTAGDLNQGQLAKLLEVDSVHHEIAGPLVRFAGDRPTILFCTSVEQSKALADVIQGYLHGTGKHVRHVDGTTPDAARKRILAEYASGEVQFISNVGVLTEGFDAPATACVALARPTKSRSLYAQMVGRSTRTLPGVIVGLDDALSRRMAIAASSKPNALLLDFRGNAGRHDLANPIDLLAGKDLPPDVRKILIKAAKDGKILDTDAISEAEAEIVKRLEAADRKRAAALALQVKAQVTAKTIELFKQTLGVEKARTTRPITEGQCRTLIQMGMDEARVGKLTFDQASTQIDKLIQRRKNGLCSYKQARKLAEHGFDPNVSFQTAKAIMDALVQNGWRSTPELRAQFEGMK